MSKGGRPRPSAVSAQQYRENWERTFAPKKDDAMLIWIRTEDRPLSEAITFVRPDAE